MTDLRPLLRELPVFAGATPDFDVAAVPAEPVGLFRAWLLEAIRAGVPEPHAMTLATTDADGLPSARVLILKDVLGPDDGGPGWQFAVHAASPKGRDLAARPYAALTFHWPALARQIRLRGPVVPADAEASAEDFRARGLPARAEALLGRQSTPLTDQAGRDRDLAAARERLDRDPAAVAEAWTLCTLRPERVEFWQGRKDRDHVRLAYDRDGTAWRTERLWP
ncbi:pyridoxine/pyridoxamine 5'-phosphate oxidase [Streptomyces avicenniae]|uniref:pyridoxine/pyridoxamine 5'-phosphate oxidase n=1 Tax=Streptomyces avicenniae TaxID=500153 RepID=UPI0006993529|nr:pyridoxal 5'-phosphate synthase [Streptomyces avicenniae]